MGQAAKTATKPKLVPYPSDRKEIAERGMEIADLKTVIKRLAGIKEAGDTDADMDPEAGKGYSIGIGMAGSATIPPKKSPEAEKYVSFNVSRRAVMIMRKRLPEAATKKELLEIPGFIPSTFSYGKARVDPERKNTLILEIEGADRSAVTKLKKALKGTACSKVELWEGGKPVELPKDEDEEGVQTVEAQTEGDDVETAGMTQGDVPAPPTPPWNRTEVTARMTKFIKEFAEGAKTYPDKVADLRTMADAMRKTVATGTEPEAVEAVDKFEAALKLAKESAGPGGSGGVAASTITKSGQAWSATLKKVEDELGKLESALTAHYGDQPFAGQLATLFKSKTGPIVTTLDTSLGKSLEAAAAAPATEQPKLLLEARHHLEDVFNWVTGNELLSQIDDNPFAPLQTKKMLTATVQLLRKSIGA